MKAVIYTLVALMTLSLGLAAPVKVTEQGYAYGHHGQCGSWNGCIDAATCAQMVCNINGFSSVVSYTPANCGDPGITWCSLFSSQSSVDCSWGYGCVVPVVTDVWCDNGAFAPYCNYELPNQDNPPQGGDNGGDVPEFTLIGAGLVAAAGAGYLLVKRRK